MKTKYYQDGLLLERYRPLTVAKYKSLRLHRLQMGTVLQRHLFPTRPSDEKSDDDFEALMRAQTDCSLEQLCEVEKIRHLQKQLEAIQQERVAVMLKCRQLSADMKVMRASFCAVMTYGFYRHRHHCYSTHPSKRKLYSTDQK